MFSHRVLFGALALAATSTTASAAVVLHISSFITTPIATNDFESIGTALWAMNTAYTQGGATVTYVTTSNFDDGVFTTTGSAIDGTSGSHSWVTIDNHGYTSIRLANGDAFDQVQFAAQSGREGLLHYQLMYQGNAVGTGVTQSVAFAGIDPANISGFSGEWFDEIRVKSSSSLVTQFEANANDSLYLDDISIGRSVAGAVPEPATWAMLIVGFGAIGTMIRKPRRMLALVR